MEKMNNTRTRFFIILLIISFIFPILGLLLTSFFYFFAKGKKTAIITSILFGVLIAFFAYNFIPDSKFDLVRHQALVNSYSEVHDVDSFVSVYKSSGMELIPQLYSFVISRIGDVNLLQFFPVAIGYSALFYILVDYKNKIKLKNYKFIPVFILVLFGQSTLYYFSGLYNYTAINLFALAFYLDYFKTKKFSPCILYVSTFFIHTSMVLPIGLLMLYKLCNSKSIKRPVVFGILGVCVLLLLLLFGGVGEYLIPNIINPLRKMFLSYAGNNERFSRFYRGFGLVVDLIKIGLILMNCWLLRKDKNNSSAKKFVLFLSIVVVALLPISIVVIRFASLALFLSIPMLMDLINDDKRRHQYVLMVYVLVAILFTGYNIRSIYQYGYKNFIINKITLTLPELLEEGNK